MMGGGRGRRVCEGAAADGEGDVGHPAVASGLCGQL